ncbi:MAG: SDR family NAD(P)-dependent oxidoreductase [Actinobacteria bacterium]|nr:SDR family NAD(P)-dependent oxidoreductase [Actinomycetota bacterium]
MTGMFEGRVAIVTGAGRGLGREHALLLASEGAAIVVNDLGGSSDGSGSDVSPAQSVVDEIVAAGGQAIANADDVSDWDGAGRLVQQAVDEFGRLDVLINNAGILRDRMLVNLSEDEWDVVMRVNAKGHVAPLRHAAAYWREQAKEHGKVSAAVVNTSSPSALFANVGQSNYGAAKMAVAGLTMIAAKELERYGVRVNTIAPAARTRMTVSPSTTPVDPDAFDRMNPGNVAPWVAYLCSDQCTMTGKCFVVYAGSVVLVEPWKATASIQQDRRWTLDELVGRGPELDIEFQSNNPFGY